MKTIIIDDDITAIELLADLLKQYEDVEIVGTATSGKEGLELTKANKPHIIFLNMDLPDSLNNTMSFPTVNSKPLLYRSTPSLCFRLIQTWPLIT